MSAPDFDFAWSMAAVPRRYSQSTSGRSSSQVTARTVARSIAGQRSGGMGLFPEIQLATVVELTESIRANWDARPRSWLVHLVRFITSFSHRLNNNASLKRIHVISLRQSNCLVKLIDDIRRENLAKLAEELGSITALAKQLDRSDSQVSQWIHGSAHSATGKPRGMRTDTARFVEIQCGKPLGWLDVDHSSEKSSLSADNTSAVPWAAYQQATAATRAAIDLLLLPTRERAAVLSAAPPALAGGVDLIEQYAESALEFRKRA
ncbi:helix-turn-helix domain-containing protein [Xylella fastidiosa]|nr:helix-turn-helix domain-containing protein [Xylella fastidiosa]